VQEGGIFEQLARPAVIVQAEGFPLVEHHEGELNDVLAVLLVDSGGAHEMIDGTPARPDCPELAGVGLIRNVAQEPIEHDTFAQSTGQILRLRISRDTTTRS